MKTHNSTLSFARCGKLWRFAVIPAIALALMLTPFSGNLHATTLTIQFTGMNLVYDGTDVYDATSILGGSGLQSQSDQLTNMDFFLDTGSGPVFFNSLSTAAGDSIFADVYIKNVLNIPATGGTVTSGGNGPDFGFDILTEPTSPGWGLALNLDKVDIVYQAPVPNVQILLQSGVASSVEFDNLPFGLQVDYSKPVSFAFVSTSVTQTSPPSGGFITGFTATGTGIITLTVPEPSAIVTAAGFGLLSLTFGLRRRLRFRANW